MASETSKARAPERFEFQAEANRLLHLVIHSLYTNKEIFLRELLSNASDALDKLRFRSLTDHDLVPSDHELAVRITPDADAGTLCIADSGIGMTRDELIRNLGTIAQSGTRAFVEALGKSGQAEGEGKGKGKGKATSKAKGKGKGKTEGEAADVESKAEAAAEAVAEDPAAALKLIGQFGVGFYSAFLVADRVEVVSRAAGSDEAWRWTSKADGAFEIETAEREGPGTDILLHLNDEQKDLADEWRLRGLVERYSDYIDHPILLRVEKKDGEGDDANTVFEYEKINRASALWRRPKSEITDEQYADFYKHLSHDTGEPLARVHFTLEGTQEFSALLFVPKTPPFDLYWQGGKQGLRLYVRRVFILDEADVFLPSWLRFVKGVVDSDDLPLNVSRETLQDSAAVRQIRRNVVNKLLGHFESLAEDEPETWTEIWTRYGPVLKEGFHDFEHRERLLKLARFKTSRDEAWSSLAHYVERMPDGQDSIYYVLGESAKRLADSPHVEALKKRGFEYLYLTDAVDPWAISAVPEFEGKKLVDAMSGDLDFGDDEETKKRREERTEELEPLLASFRKVLEESVREVRVSDRLTDSPCCLVTASGHESAFLERLLHNAGREAETDIKRILEINPDHRIIRGLAALAEKEAGDGKGDAEPSEPLREWISILHDQALLTEGSTLHDPTRFVRRMNELLEATLPESETEGDGDSDQKGNDS